MEAGHKLNDVTCKVYTYVHKHQITFGKYVPIFDDYSSSENDSFS